MLKIFHFYYVFFSEGIDKEELKEIHSMLLSPKRYIAPDEIAHLVQAVIENPAINAENIRIDCGWRYSHIKDAKELSSDKIC